MQNGFKRFDLNQSTLNALARMGFEEPTPIQEEAIPMVMKGADVTAQARTGTGKTAAFGIPLVEATRGRHVQSLVLAPTRELANQIAEELNQLGHGSGFKAFAVYGGVGFGKQREAMARTGNGRATCIVACPGRLLDLLERGWADVSGVRTVVLDEADRMLDMGFIHDIKKILGHLNRDRQTLLFSATLPPEVRRLAQTYQHDPIEVKVSAGPTATTLTDQYKVRVQGEGMPHLLTLLEREDPERAVVFVSTKHTARRVSDKLRAAGYKASALQGNLSQSKRDTVMASFRRGDIRLMVATDVAARGIDVDELSHVIQFDMPAKPEDHVHRTGRTGRAGRQGRAFLFVPAGQEGKLNGIERAAGVPFEAYELGQVQPVPGHVAKAGAKPRRYESITAGGSGGGSRGGGGGYRGGGKKRGRGGGHGGGGGGGGHHNRAHRSGRNQRRR